MEIVRERLDVKARDRPDLVGADLAPRRVHLRKGRTAGRRVGEPA